MRILGVDTATTIASVALVQDGQLLAQSGHEPQSQIGIHPSAKGNHSETVLPMIQAVLQQAALQLADLTAIAISIGPGSFTGLRIGLALVKGLAYQSALPVVGVSSLEAQAGRVNDFAGVLCPLLDARKGEVYAALFDADGGKLQRRMADRVLAVSELATVAELIEASTPITFVGNGAERYRTELAQLFDGRAQILPDGRVHSVGHAVARLALERFADAGGADLSALAPLYLGSSQALGITRVNLPNPLI